MCCFPRSLKFTQQLTQKKEVFIVQGTLKPPAAIIQLCPPAHSPMSHQVDSITLRDAVFKACSSLDSFEDMPFSSVRQEAERLLDLEHRSLRDRKEEIIGMIMQFRNVHKSKKRMSKGEEGEDGEAVVKKRGKFSVHESELILSTCRDYLEANGLELSDICSEKRAKNEKYNRHTVLWDNVTGLFPHRTRRSVYERARRLLMADTRYGSFSEEEKNHVKRMVERYGHDWKRISHELGRMSGDIKDLYKIMKDRKNTGHFSLQETARLIVAVKKFTNSAPEVNSFDIPYENISWTAVARMLNDERQPLDYLRHWKVVRRMTWLGPDLITGIVGTSEQRNDDRRLIAYLAEREPEHESEITWSHVDSTLLLRQSAFKRWKILCSENLLNYQMDFPGSLKALMEKYNILEGGVLGDDDDNKSVSNTHKEFPAPGASDIPDSSSSNGKVDGHAKKRNTQEALDQQKPKKQNNSAKRKRSKKSESSQ